MAKVLPAPDLNVFLNALEQSSLLSAEALTKARETAEGTPDPKAIARDLLKSGDLTRWQAGQLLHGYAGLVVGKYALLDQIGSGEMGRVYLAEHVQMNRRVALKVLSRRHTQRPDVLKRFLADAEKTASLDHRNLIHVYDVNVDGDRYFLVMEYVEGQDLQKTVEKSGKLPARQALGYIRQVAEGLQHAHEKQVFHGDLKPTNLLVDAQGTVKVLDLGLGKLAEVTNDAIGEETTETASLASRIYHAPEQQAQGNEVDFRADIYSLGSTLYFLLTGQLPSGSAVTAEEVEAAAPGTPQSIADLCQQLTAKNPADRPPSMNAVLELIDAALQYQAAAPPPKAKAEPATGKPKVAGNGKPAAAPPRAKKPPVAKALDLGPAPKATAKPASAKSGAFAAIAASEPESAAEETPFGSFGIDPSGKKPAPAAKKAAVPQASATPEPTEVEEPAATPAKPKKGKSAKKGGGSALPLILAGSIGGGVLVLGAIIALIVVLFGGGKTQEVAQVEVPATAVVEVAPDEANPESNPEVNPTIESNPVIEANPVIAEEPATAATADPPADPAGGDDKPAVTAVAANADPMPPEGDDPKAEPMPKPEVKKAEPPKAAPPKPMPKAAPPKDPLQGFAKAVDLPALPSGSEEPSAEALAPLALGPCKVPQEALVIVNLKGGETAVRGAKQMFTLMAANGGTANQDWEISLGGTGSSSNTLVAKMGVKDDKLHFQWTPEGAKDPSAGSLANCALEVSAGTGHHIFAMRTPVDGETLGVDFDKSMSPAKWTIENLPDSEKVVVEVTKVTGFGKQQFDPDALMEGNGDEATVWTGPGDDVMILGLKLKSTIGSRNISVAAIPQFKLQGMPKPDTFIKNKFSKIAGGIEQQMMILNNQLGLLQKLKDPEKSRRKAILEQQFGGTVEDYGKAKAQADQLVQIATQSSGNAQVNFRVYYMADDVQVELLTTGAPAAAK